MKRPHETGIALIVTLLLTFVFTLLAVGFFYLVAGEQKISASDRDNNIAYYGAQASLEKMSAQLAGLLQTNAAPMPADVSKLMSRSSPFGPPTIPGVTFQAPSGGWSSITSCSPAPSGGYSIGCTLNPDNTTLKSYVGQINGTGPLNGLQGIIVPFTLTVVADSVNGAEVKLTRQVQAIAVPVFQFGIFDDKDLSFSAGADFGFGGRVHTNGNLFLTEDAPNTLTLNDKVTALGDIVRVQMSNGYQPSCPGNPGCGTVTIKNSSGSTTRDLRMNPDEGSAPSPGGTPNGNWQTISLTNYRGYLANTATGAKRLNLAFALPNSGSTPIEMIRRPPVGESVTSTLGAARFFNQASLRIVLSDSKTAITGLPGVTSADPYPLDETLIDRSAGPGPYPFPHLPPTDACHPPIASSRGNSTDSDYMSPVGTGLLAGAAALSYIKIEIQTSPGTWQDVTPEILSLGFSKDVGTTCGSNNSIIYLERLAPDRVQGGGAEIAKHYVPINMYDQREGDIRDVTRTSALPLGGIISIVELDVHNLQRWFANTLDPINAPSGSLAMKPGGYIVYFSDRRGNSNGTGETAEYGYEDIINPSDPAGAPNGQLDAAEDVNGNGTLDVYGATPRTSYTPVSAWSTFLGSANPVQTKLISQASVAEKNGVLFFRRALRLVNGQLGNLPPLAHANCSDATAGGFTVTAENPVYVLGDYNADTTHGWADTASLCHVPAAVIADAVTVLSNNWSAVDTLNPTTYKHGRDGDWRSLELGDTFGTCGTPFTSTLSRCASDHTYVRVAVMAGKNISFPKPGWAGHDFGTDGGAHNFIRYIEDWSRSHSYATLHYTGSLMSFWYSRQAIGIFKHNPYNAPARDYHFDIDFTNISKLPPGTPRFTDVNALSYSQSFTPN